MQILSLLISAHTTKRAISARSLNNQRLPGSRQYQIITWLHNWKPMSFAGENVCAKPSSICTINPQLFVTIITCQRQHLMMSSFRTFHFDFSSFFSSHSRPRQRNRAQKSRFKVAHTRAITFRSGERWGRRTVALSISHSCDLIRAVDMGISIRTIPSHILTENVSGVSCRWW